VRTYALIDDAGRVLDLAVGDAAWAQGLVGQVRDPQTATPPALARLASVRELTADERGRGVAAGWYRAGNGVLADGRPTLTADRQTIPPDGTTAAVVTYSRSGPDTPAAVGFTVNGTASQLVNLTDGRASIEVTSSHAGDSITVEADGASLVVRVTS
jgi:hypothetical protein